METNIIVLILMRMAVLSTKRK